MKFVSVVYYNRTNNNIISLLLISNSVIEVHGIASIPPLPISRVSSELFGVEGVVT